MKQKIYETMNSLLARDIPTILNSVVQNSQSFS